MTLSPSLSLAVPVEKSEAVCYHCRLPVDDGSGVQAVKFDDKVFCCEGCKTVFEILNANDLCAFYDLDQRPGISLKGRRQAHYAWLDEPDLRDKLLNFSDGKQSRTTFYLPQIHCASCLWLLENLYKLSPGIKSSKVNFLKKEVYITFANETVSLRQVVELLASIGYAPEINLGSLDQAVKKPVAKRLIYQLGLAGFAFGNIMLLSFPEYLGLDASDNWFRQLFGYLNILLATPVVFYSGGDYLKGAWHSLRTWSPGIDIPLALGITVLYARSVFEIITSTGGGYLDSLAGLVFFLLIGKWFQQVTYHRISFDRDYRSYFPVSATRILPGGGEEASSLDSLRAGDTILVRHGELIPADGILTKGNARVDYSFVTGEAEPVDRNLNEKLYAGGRQVAEAIEIVLTKKVSQSYLTQLWNDDTFKKEKLEGTSRLADQVSRWFTLIVLTVAFGTLAYWWPKDVQVAINAFTAVLIIACPCAAALNVPFTLGNAVRILARLGFYIKNTNVIEALHGVRTVVFDKTGTLTSSNGNGIAYLGETLTKTEQAGVSALARQSSHPLSRQLAALESQSGVKLAVENFEEKTGQGIEGRVGEDLLRLGSRSFILPGREENLSEEKKSGVYLEINGKPRGHFIFNHHYRQQVWDVLAWFRQRYKVFLLSGDNEGEQHYLAPKFGANGQGEKCLFFNQSPHDKLAFVKNLQSESQKVLMLGDGLNDAGALRQSDIGIAVSEDTNNFTPACDAILDARYFSKLPAFLAFAKKSIHVVYAGWALAVVYNVVGLSFATQGNLSPVVAAILMPLSSLTIVLFGTGLTTLLAPKMPKNLLPNHKP
ncbi:MAG: heavy metal translocating P-type ATPase metal-binding domain-containing protein [Saprospiraceae bacterium]